MDKHPAIWLAALTPAACLSQKAAQPVPLPSPQAQTAATEKRADTFQADEAKIARNMAAWDKLMALPVDDCGLLSRRKTMGFGF